MFFSDKITLRAVTRAPDSYGDSIPSYTDTVVWANKKSVTRSEFYAANMAGVKIDAVFEVHAEDYEDQMAVTFDSANYEVMRAYAKGEGTFELMCSVREV